jgi:hypothetical protein
MRQAGDTAASQYEFRRQDEPNTGLCGKDQRGDSDAS